MGTQKPDPLITVIKLISAETPFRCWSSRLGVTNNKSANSNITPYNEQENPNPFHCKYKTWRWSICILPGITQTCL